MSAIVLKRVSSGPLPAYLMNRRPNVCQPIWRPLLFISRDDAVSYCVPATGYLADVPLFCVIALRITRGSRLGWVRAGKGRSLQGLGRVTTGHSLRVGLVWFRFRFRLDLPFG